MSDKINAEVVEINGQRFVREDLAQASQKERKGAWVIGANYLIRTVTMTDVGRLLYIDENELILGDASWVADSGRFNDALKKGILNEVEPFEGEAIIGRGSICDAVIWNHPLPKVQK